MGFFSPLGFGSIIIIFSDRVTSALCSIFHFFRTSRRGAFAYKVVVLGWTEWEVAVANCPARRQQQQQKVKEPITISSTELILRDLFGSSIKSFPRPALRFLANFEVQ